MQSNKTDLNLLPYLDVLLRERNVTKAADQLGLTQPAMSNGLSRLRKIFDDPLLIRTSEGMTPTERAVELQPLVREVLGKIDQVIQPKAEFDASVVKQVFRIMASDYAESTILSSVLRRLRTEAPGIALDIMTPSDVSFNDVEQGRVDLAINRFDAMPQSFHQKTIWRDDFTCLVSAKNAITKKFTLENYLKAQHVWVSKTGMGVGVGVDPEDVQRLGWVDEALTKLGKYRNIAVFTRHYHVAMLLVEQNDLIVTIPTKAAKLQAKNSRVVMKKPPFKIAPIDLKMAWSPLLQNNPGHKWMRRLIVEVAECQI